MIPADRERFGRLIADVLGFYGQTPSVFALGVWWQACQAYDLDAVQAAFGRHAMDPERGQWPPKPADLVRQMQGSADDRAALAWSLVLGACSRVGAYADVAFDDPIIHAVVADLGGWPTLCRTETEALSYTQHRFVQAYRAYAHRGAPDHYPPVLHGDRSPDETYLARGLPPPRPVLVGDPVRARHVMANGLGGGAQLYTLADAVDSAARRLNAPQDAQEGAGRASSALAATTMAGAKGAPHRPAQDDMEGVT